MGIDRFFERWKVWYFDSYLRFFRIIGHSSAGPGGGLSLCGLIEID